MFILNSYGAEREEGVVCERRVHALDACYVAGVGGNVGAGCNNRWDSAGGYKIISVGSVLIGIRHDSENAAPKAAAATNIFSSSLENFATTTRGFLC